ncbi:MAG: DUF3298 domain-containing protein [Bacteroidales bacterium]|nr:DUF3298 domain-containing protein [Bacteroidales bacterium]
MLHTPKHIPNRSHLMVLLVVASCLGAACHRTNNELTTTRTDTRLYVLSTQIEGEGDFEPTIGFEYSYSLEWPTDALLNPTDQARVAARCFLTDKPMSFDSAAAFYMETDEEDGLGEMKIVHKLPNCPYYETKSMQGDMQLGNAWATLIVKSDITHSLAAHGSYAELYFNMDRDRKQLVELSDIVDTTHLSTLLLSAIDDVEENHYLHEALWEEYATDGLPLAEDFYIDSSHTKLVLVYQQYAIAAYCYGICRLHLPISWLREKRLLTPYAEAVIARQKPTA